MSNINDTITYGTAKFKVVKNITSENIKNIGINGNGEISQNEDGVPVATILPFSGNGNIPIGYLLCDGSAVSREAYPDLFSIIGTTFGAGNGVDTFNLPDLTDKFIEGSITAGSEIDAGLPNIVGELQATSTNISTSGAFSQVASTNKNGLTYASNMGYRLRVDASDSNAIYGNSDTVQPPALTMRYIIKAFNGMDNDEALVDLTGMANDLNQKFDPRSDFTIIYPNSGNAEEPANITYNSSYVMSNPFPGYAVDCVVEVLYHGTWGDPHFVYYQGGFVAKASQVSSGDIVIQTGSNGTLLYDSNKQGNPFQSTMNISSAPCRVKIWKIGNVVNNT